MAYVDPTDPSRDDTATVTLHRDHWRALTHMLDLFADQARDDHQDDVAAFRDSTAWAIDAQTADQGDESAEKRAVVSYVRLYLRAFPSDKRGDVETVRRALWEQAEFDGWSADEWDVVEYAMRHGGVSREERMAVIDGLRDGGHLHVPDYNPSAGLWGRDE